MKRRGLPAVVGAAAVGLGVIAAGTAPAVARHLALHATGTVDSSHFIDADHDGRPSAGDRLVQHETLRRGRYALGELTTACEIATATRAVCTFVWHLPHGDLTGSGQATDDLTAPLHIAVTGGTGRYRLGAGVVRIVNDPADPGARDRQDFDGVLTSR